MDSLVGYIFLILTVYAPKPIYCSNITKTSGVIMGGGDMRIYSPRAFFKNNLSSCDFVST